MVDGLESLHLLIRLRTALAWAWGSLVEGGKKEFAESDDQLVPDRRLPDGHDVVSEPGVVIVRQDVEAVAGSSRNIPVKAAGGIEGSNGTRPRRVTLRPPKARRYIHFDDPLTVEQIEALVLTSAGVASHSFFPLLGYSKTTRKVDFSVFPPLVKQKEREIRFAGHKDAAIYSVYAKALSVDYEDYLGKSDFGASVLAYRSGIGYNVPFAKALIDEVRARGDCVVICLDVSGFFDNLRHDKLKIALAEVLGVDRLRDDWFKIYSRLTGFEFVVREDIEDAIGRPGGRRICSAAVFRSAIRPLIQRNLKTFGIPQGTPLSGLLANIYMVSFDRDVHAYLAGFGGSYRRYSDDIAIVLPPGASVEALVAFVDAQIEKLGLTLNADKTCITAFSAANGSLAYAGPLLQYLGFTFDGLKILIRSESIKSFYARMKGNIRRYVRAAAEKGIPLAELRKRVLIGRFTHWGDSRNFVQYAYRAARELNAPEIRRQLRNHVPIFDEQWAKAVAKYGT